MSLYGPSNDPYIELYEELAEETSKCGILSSVDQDELVSHYQDAAFFIHPNIWEETFCVRNREAMKCGCYPIITNIGALEEVATENFASVVPIDGVRTPQKYEVTEHFLNTFTEVCCTAIDYFEGDRSYYNQLSKSLSNHISQKCDWEKIAKQWKKLISKIITGETMNEQNISLPTSIGLNRLVSDEDYLKLAFDNVLRWEESDREHEPIRKN